MDLNSISPNATADANQLSLVTFLTIICLGSWIWGVWPRNQASASQPAAQPITIVVATAGPPAAVAAAATTTNATTINATFNAGVSTGAPEYNSEERELAERARTLVPGHRMDVDRAEVTFRRIAGNSRLDRSKFFLRM